ncbi:MAG TPA: hypothetical protein PKE12_02145 [Kiritimatiellia bacterium]|nr:hypothetical protein [Kiritimatiellia bacterium]
MVQLVIEPSHQFRDLFGFQVAVDIPENPGQLELGDMLKQFGGAGIIPAQITRMQLIPLLRGDIRLWTHAIRLAKLATRQQDVAA